MAFSLAQKLVSLGFVPPLAKELANQLQSGVFNKNRLIGLGMVPPLAAYLAASLASGTYVARKAMELSLTEAGAIAIGSFGIRPSGLSMAFDGDSRIAINWSGTGTHRDNRGLLFWTEYFGSQRYDSSFGLNFAVSGEGTTAILARAATTAASSAQAVLALMSTNDRGVLTAAQSLANIASWVAIMRAANKVVFLCDEMPRTDLSGSLLTEHLAVRDGIRAMINPAGGVYIVPTWNAIASPTNNQVADPDLLYDIVHPNSRGASVASAAVMPTISYAYDSREVLSGGTNSIINPGMTGTAGTVTAPALGVAPTSWNFNVRADLAPAIATGSKVTQDGKEWARISISGTPTAGTIPEARFFQEVSIVGFNTGDVVEGLMRVKITSLSGIRHVALQALYGNALASLVSDGFGTGDYNLIGGPWSGVYRTPQFTIPVTNTQMRLMFLVRGLQNVPMVADVMVTDAVWRKVS